MAVTSREIFVQKTSGIPSGCKYYYELIVGKGSKCWVNTVVKIGKGGKKLFVAISNNEQTRQFCENQVELERKCSWKERRKKNSVTFPRACEKGENKIKGRTRRRGNTSGRWRKHCGIGEKDLVSKKGARDKRVERAIVKTSERVSGAPIFEPIARKKALNALSPRTKRSVVRSKHTHTHTNLHLFSAHYQPVFLV